MTNDEGRTNHETGPMKKEMLINVLQPEECRIAIVEDGVLEELYVERSSQESYVGNIYKGRIVNIEPSIQAAFVDFGIGRNGFLHVSDVDPAYYKHLMSKEALAEYEADLDREHGGGGGGGNRGRPAARDDRGPRGERPRDRTPDAPPPPREVTAWLEPQPAAAPTPASNDDDDDDAEVGFASGLDEDEAAGFAEEVVDEAPAAPPPPPRPARTEARKPTPPPAPPADDEDAAEFGAGVMDDDAADFASGVPDEVAEARPPAAEPAEPEPEAAEPKARKPRARRTTKKADEPAEPPAADAPDDAPAEGKPKAKGRRTRKKADGEGDADGETPDDKPKIMGGAERRTSAPDDEEPEIKPFFEGGGDFDVDAPNDRFAGETAQGGTADDEDDDDESGFEAEPAEAEAPEFARDEASEPRAERPPAAQPGRGFNDDFDDARVERTERDRGGRGGPSRDRGGDRGGRGGPPRDRDRGGDRGGDRAGRGGPPRDRGPDRGPRTGAPGGPPGARIVGRDRGLPKPPIQEIFKRGQEVIVQVIKEGIGTKGPTLSTYVSIAGRYLVLMPSLNRVGVSRKIEDHEARRRLREIMGTLSPPKGVGFIVRTAAVDRDAQELRNDLAYLLRLWQVVVKRIKRVAAPVEIYRESDMITRTIRDIFTSDVDAIWVDEPNAFAHASEFLQIVMPRYASRIKFVENNEPLFNKYGIEDEIAKIHQKRLDLPEGGSIIIEQTEALVAIDVNSGNFRAENNAEETAYQMNLRAAREIARQLRLRDLGGVIVNDFIDMRSETHRRNVENALRDAMRRDRARAKILRISQFGIIEMTRQRIRPSLKRSIFADCPHCRGTAFVKTSESMSIEVMRSLCLAAHRTPAIASVHVTVHADVANYLLNRKRKEIAALEERAKMEVVITGQTGISPDTGLYKCLDHNGAEVRLVPPPAPRLAGGRQPARGVPERRFPQPLD